MYAFDTNIFVEFLRGRLPITRDMLMKGDASMFAVPSVVRAELLFGAERSAKPTANRMLVERLLAPFQPLDFDARCASAYARIQAELAAKGQLIGPNDLLIAATALVNEATLVTRNVREFQRVPGLRVECWDELELA